MRVTALAVSAMLAGACGGGPSDDDAIAALLDGFMDPGDVAAALFETAPAANRDAYYQCVATELVAEIGADRLIDTGVLVLAGNDNFGMNPEATFSQEHAGTAADIIFDCANGREEFLNDMRGTGAEQAPLSFVNCLDVSVDYDQFKGWIALELRGMSAEATEAIGNINESIGQIAEDCLVGAVMADVQQGLLDQLDTEGADRAFLKCFEDRMDWDLVREGLVLDAQGREDEALAMKPGIDEAITDTVAACA